MDYRLASRMDSVEASPFLAVLQAARAVESRGRHVIYLSMGEPDFPTPANVKSAGIAAIEQDQTRYTAMDGMPELKDAICRKLLRDNALHYERNEVTVTPGGTQAIFNVMFATVGPGDEVVLPAPFFQPYIAAIRLAGAEPKIIATREADGFVPRAADIAAAITERTRWVVLNSPSNPAGAVLEEPELSAIAGVIREHSRVLVLSDDIYESIVFDDRPFRNIVNVCADFRERTVILNGVSKAYAMTGWRLGYLAGPADIIGGVSQVTANTSFTSSSIAQAAAVEALDGSQEIVARQTQAYERRRDAVVKWLGAIPGLTCAVPKGAFYLFINCTHFIGKHTVEGKLIASDQDFVLHVLNAVGVALVPGSAFGMPGYVRISYAAAESVLEEAFRRLAAACEQLR